jgi:hypothetical protein
MSRQELDARGLQEQIASPSRNARYACPQKFSEDGPIGECASLRATSPPLRPV